VHSFFDLVTNTISHVVADPETQQCAVIDTVMDYEPNAAKASFESADRIINFIKEKKFKTQWVLETHVHADHLSAAPYLQKSLGGILAIGENIKTVQEVFGEVFNLGTEFKRDASQFGHLFQNGEVFKIGNIEVKAIHTPGHTPADMTYVAGDAAFVGDTLFMPDFGTARCDFPGGSAEEMYQSIQKIFKLPDETRVFLCHDYLVEGRTEYVWETTIRAQKQRNIHVGNSADEASFIKMRIERDAKLGMPKLIIPSIQTNIRAGNFPEAGSNGTTYLKVPINTL
jgi:glyoxylase-like metal-dependent hydrolase (beta-lactamase superfamily II)